MYRNSIKHIIKFILIINLLWGCTSIFSQETRSNKVEFALNNLPDAVPPTIKILSPVLLEDLNHQTIAGEINLVGEVKDESPIKFVAVSADKKEINSSGIFSASVELYPGENHIRMVAADAYNNLEELFITIEYTPPGINLE